MASSFYALFCEVDPTKEAVRHEVRGDHLAFLGARKARIHFGGPLIGPGGMPETMLIVLNAESASDASHFMDDEPYHRSGVFRSIVVKPWVQVLPEAHEGAMDEAIAAERALHK